MTKQERKEGETKGPEKRKRGEDDSLTQGFSSALEAGKACFTLNHRKWLHWKQIGVWSRWTGSSLSFS